MIFNVFQAELEAMSTKPLELILFDATRYLTDATAIAE